MKTELRTVTVKREVYIACDGTEFEESDMCESYEMELKEQELNLRNRDFEKCSLDECMYAQLDTPEDVKAMQSLCVWTGVTCKGIEGVGIYVYISSYKDYWLNLTSIFNTLTEGKK